MLRRFAPAAALYTVVVSLALPLTPLTAQEEQGAETEAEPQATVPAAPDPPPVPPPQRERSKPEPERPQPAPAQPEPAPAPEPQRERKPQARAAAAASVSIRDFSFAPATVTVATGESVTWTNNGEQPHTATGDGFDTGNLDPGESGSHTFSSAGTFSYICTPHPFMKGTVVVRAASSGGGTGGQTSDVGPQTSAAQDGAAAPDNRPRLADSGAEPLPLLALGCGLLALGFLTRRRLEQDPR